MIDPILLASLPSPGEGAPGPSGQARAPDGWEAVFSEVLLNFISQQDEVKGESLAGAAGVAPPVVAVPIDAGFPVIDQLEGQTAVPAAGETGNQPVLTAAAGATPAFVPPAAPDVAAVPAEAGPAVLAPLPDAQAAGEASPALTQAVPATQPVMAAGEAAVVNAPVPAEELAAPGKPVETVVSAAKGQAPSRPEGTAHLSAPPAESPSAPAGETVREEAAPAPVVSATPAELDADPNRVEPAAEAARPVQAPDPTVLQAQYNPPEARAVDPRPVQAVEGKDQGVLMQMVDTIQSSVQKGQSSLRLQLNPQELGSIDVRLVSNPQGVGVTVFADQASTGRLLELQIEQLRTSLQEAGVQLTHLNVFQHSQQRQEAPADWNRRFSPRRQAAFSQQAEPAAEAAAAPRRGQSVVDYRV